jgi:uncharacterized membrane protein YphA (DoxX/SURF4 family)
VDRLVRQASVAAASLSIAAAVYLIAAGALFLYNDSGLGVPFLVPVAGMPGVVDLIRRRPVVWLYWLTFGVYALMCLCSVVFAVLIVLALFVAPAAILLGFACRAAGRANKLPGSAEPENRR